jgi:hypothetical protein
MIAIGPLDVPTISNCYPLDSPLLGCDIKLTLTRLKDGRFFLHPARLPVARLGVQVEAVCPEAFSSPEEEDVSLCPRVQARAFARMLRAAL